MTAPGKVVVIDDEREVCELIGRVLLRAGYQVVTCQTGPLGLELLEQGAEPVCLLVDKLMPGMGGLEVMAEARRRRPHLPVVLITGHPEPFQLGDAQPDLVLTKPFSSLDVIVDAVATAVEGTRPRAGRPLTALRERVVAVVTEMAPGLKRRDQE